MGKSRKESMEKAEQKFEKKLQFYSRVRDTVAALNAKKVIAKKKKKRRRGQKQLKAFNLSSLTEALPQQKENDAPLLAKQISLPKFNNSSKSRQKLVLLEDKQLKAVLSHPLFQSNPFEALHQHLQITQHLIDDKPSIFSSK